MADTWREVIMPQFTRSVRHSFSTSICLNAEGQNNVKSKVKCKGNESILSAIRCLCENFILWPTVIESDLLPLFGPPLILEHITPDLTLNTYVRTREDRLAKLTEEVGDRILPSEKCAIYVPQKRKRDSTPKSNSFHNNELDLAGCNGGGGIRTPVPRCFKTSVYMFSRLIVFSPY